MNSSLGQKERLAILLLYVGILSLVSFVTFGVWIPPLDNKGLWFYAGLAALLMGSLLETPFYTSPKDAISNAIAAILTLVTVNIWTPSYYSLLDRALWLGVVIYATVTIVFSIVAIALKDTANILGKRIGQFSAVFCSTIGTPKWMFSSVYIFALVTFHRNSPSEYLVISIAWFVIVALQPIETFFYLAIRLKEIVRKTTPSQGVGEIVGYQTPNLIVISQNNDSQVSYGDIIVTRTDKNTPGLAMVLDHLGFVNARWFRAFMIDTHQTFQAQIDRVLGGEDVVKPDVSVYQDMIDENSLWQAKGKLIGLVAPETNIVRLRIDITRDDVPLKEGCLVETQINESRVLYQVVSGLTQKEILQQKNTRGFVRADAKKIGVWNEIQGNFETVEWVPAPNAPVFLVESRSAPAHRDAVGYFPGTNYPVSIKNINQLVTHNTAILGILGIGKSFLAFELIERMIDSGIKVLCLDLTNQYAQHLSPFYDEVKFSERIEALQAIGPRGKTNVQRNVQEGGSINQFRELLRTQLSEFLSPDNKDMLAIFNPTEFEVWRQDSKPYDNRASMALLTPPQITQIFAETALEILQMQGMTENARCCLVFEEAHSLIPEWNSVVDDGDKTATNGTARAILQGRKFGLGCMVVTQRTANVTKSILNQCNTVFALRVFDSTGMDFLKNYIGGDYADILSTLDDRHAIFFGKASSCRDPVLIRLNDRDDFLRLFRTTDN